LKVALLLNHGGDSNRKNTQIGRFRVALTSSPDPKVIHTPYNAVLALQTPLDKRTDAQKQAIFDAWRLVTPELKAFNDEIDKHWKAYPEAVTTVLHLAERIAQDHRETRRLDRGTWNQGKEAVQPHVPAALHPLDGPASRLAFARWLVDKRSPL